MKKVLTIACCLAVICALPAFAGDKNTELNPGFKHISKPNDNAHNQATAGGAGKLINHGGQVLKGAHVVYIFWGWDVSTTDDFVKQVVAFRNSPNGMITHMGMLSQYGATPASSLQGTQADVYDAVPPPALKVTDAMVQGEVNKYFGSSYDANTIYEVLIPNTYYSDDGTGAQSCGGTNLKYCAYHGNGDGVNLPANCKYSIQPYPSCSGCHGISSWTAANDEEHFIVHETRESMTDAQGTAWYDLVGYEADDKCAWGTNLAFLFTDNTADGYTFGYQMEYSNSARACVAK